MTADTPRDGEEGRVEDCGRVVRREHHTAHHWTFQPEDDSPAEMEATCNGWSEDVEVIRHPFTGEPIGHAVRLPPPEDGPLLVEPLARFLLEHDHCGDDYWDQQPERRRDFYRSLAEDVLAFISEAES